MISVDCVQFIQAFSKGPTDNKLQMNIYNAYLEKYFNGPLDEYHDNKRLSVFQDAFTLLWQKVFIGIIYIENNEIFIKKRGKTELLTCSLYEYLKGIIKKLNQEGTHMHREILLNDINMFVVNDEPDTEEERNRVKDLVNESLSNLHRGCSELLTLYYLNHLSRHDILVKLAPRFSSEDSVSTQIHRCKGYLRKDVKKKLVTQKDK